MTPPIVLDNTVLTNFALVNRADWVIDLLGDDAWTTTAALGEYEAGVAGGVLPPAVWPTLVVVTPTSEETLLAHSLLPRLGLGERTCLAVALLRQAILASDDRRARRMARQQGVPVTGTIGLLVIGVQHQRWSLTEANAALAQMIALGFRSPVTMLDDLIAL